MACYRAVLASLAATQVTQRKAKQGQSGLIRLCFQSYSLPPRIVPGCLWVYYKSKVEMQIRDRPHA